MTKQRASYIRGDVHGFRIYKTLFYTPTFPTLPQMIKYKENKNDLRHS